jgi:SAM-dependent methyltransferase
MPSTSGNPTSGSTIETHRYRAVAESFGVDPAAYDRWRPRYPRDLIERIRTTSPGPEVLDVGIGTGIVARQLRDSGARVTGVEPDARMAGFARAEGFVVEEATIEHWESDGRLFDALVSGQTWHWVEPVSGAAKAKQVLRPGGRVAVFWNAGDAPEEINEAFADAFARAVPDWPTPTDCTPPPASVWYNAMVDRTAEGFRSVGGFGEAERWQDSWDQSYTRDEYLALLPTQGMLTRASAEQTAAVLEAVGRAIDRLGGTFEMHYVTTTMATVRTTG